MEKMDKKRDSFEEWKKKKIERGEWLPAEDYRRKKDIERRDFLLRELAIVNRRLNPQSHEDLRKEFIVFEQESNKKRKIEEENKIKREIILDTETTGLTNSDRIVEISMIEMIDGIKTGRNFHKFLNPETSITKKAIEIHKITNEFVQNCPKFKEIAEDVIKFIGDATIIAHNSNFDMRMLNNEMERCGWEKYLKTRFIDTLEIARFLFPGEKNNQDALCERFEINNSIRSETGIHSAVEDTALLYQIYQKFLLLLEEKKLTPYDFKLETEN
jgi:DNA polymerase-3 subunit epsilon